MRNRRDEITRQTLVAVRRSFLTPFDRSDIKELTTSLDDVIGQLAAPLKRADGAAYIGAWGHVLTASAA